MFESSHSVLYQLFSPPFLSTIRDALCQTLELVELILKGILSVLPGIEGPMVEGW